MQAARLALRVRICRSKIGKRLAKRDIFQTQGEGILAAGEIPVFLGNMLFYLHELKAPMQSHRCFCIGDPYEESHPASRAAGSPRGFAFAAKPSESDSRSEAFSSGERANSRQRRDSRSATLRAPVFSTFTKTDFYAIIKKSKL